MRWLRRLFEPKPKIDLARIQAVIDADNREEDRLLDEYMKLPDIPYTIEMCRETSLTDSPVHAVRKLDYAHWCKWRDEHKAKR